ncbi:hypothetical protein FACS1894178_6260 [Bacteroidia bacterium]|nr:hypothetical protein FACS1894178_6260 [Bacteroidia bacterium]
MFVSCDKRIEKVPGVSTPEYTPMSEIMTIAELKAKAETLVKKSTAAETNNNFGYLQNPALTGDDAITDQFKPEANVFKVASCEEVGITGHIKGIVVGNDESGNIYKQFYLQDETGAILVIVNLTGMFTQFPVGQEVIVELDKLCIGKYYGAFQIGAPTVYRSVSAAGRVGYGMSRLTPNYFYSNIHRNGVPDFAKVEALMKTYTTIPASTENIRNTLVCFENATFGGYAGNQFAPNDAANTHPTGSIKLTVGGSQIDVRTSGYANFAGDIAPEGVGKVTCILGQYFEDLQVTLRGKGDLAFPAQSE